MKKLFLIGIVVILLSLGSMNVFADSQLSEQLQQKISNAIALYIESSKAFVNNQEKQIDTENNDVTPIIKDGRTLVPVRFISESLGAQVDWNEQTKGISIKYNGKYNLEYVQMKIGDKSMLISNITSDAPDEYEVNLDVEPQIINGRTFIPLRALVEAFGKKVFWDDRGLIVISDNNIFDETADKGLIDEIVGRFNETTGSSISTNPTELFRYINLTKEEVFKKLGEGYEKVATGAEGSYEGYYYKNLDITFVFISEENNSKINWIGCGENVAINGAKNGMTFEQIQVKLGRAFIADTWLETPDHKAYEINYVIGDLRVNYFAQNEDGSDGSFAIYGSSTEDKYASDEDTTFYGEWEVTKELAYPRVGSESQEEVDSAIGKKIIFNKDTAGMSNYTIANPIYAKSLVTEDYTWGYGFISFNKLGIISDRAVDVQVFENSTDNGYSYDFLIKDKDTLILHYGEPFYELKRIK